MEENYVLAISMTAAEFLEEEVSEWIELLPRIKTELKYIFNESAKYKHEIWLPESTVEELNKLLSIKQEK